MEIRANVDIERELCVSVPIRLLEIAVVRRVPIMNILRGGLMIGLTLGFLMSVSHLSLAASSSLSAATADGPSVTLTELKFNSTTLTAPPGWTIGAQHGGTISVQPTSSPDASGNTVYALEGSYPVPAPLGKEYMWANYDVAALNTEDVYIEFWAKMPGPKQGCKFVKIFGRNLTQGNYADPTIGTDYTGVDFGAIRQIGFGDGSNLANDSQNVININGTNPQWIGRSYGTASLQTPAMSTFSSADWGTGWHHFRIHVKFNTGTTTQNEVPDGEVYLEIDGKVYADATALYNRNPANGPIQSVGFFGWAQSESHAFQVWYDDIRISTGGFLSQPVPMPPASVTVK